MKSENYNFDWSDLAFSSKSIVNKLDAVFVLAPRKISSKRFILLAREYLAKNNIVIGISKEKYVAGFEDQPQFEMLQLSDIDSLIEKINKASKKYKIYTISYFQRESKYVIENLKFKEVLLINGSWRLTFHNSDIFYSLIKKSVPYKFISPFTNEEEAIAFADAADKKNNTGFNKFLANIGVKSYTEQQMMEIAIKRSHTSFDNAFQGGLALGRKKSGKYEYIVSAYNRVVPYQTYAMLNGSVREQNYSPPNDLNFYDTVHAETELIIIAQKNKFDLKNSTAFINLLPCPTCARLISETDISEIVYKLDHSDGYAIKMLEKAGKVVRRLVV